MTFTDSIKKILLASILFLFLSCRKEQLLKMDGKWNFSLTENDYINGVIINSSVENGSMVFNEGGTGLVNANSSSSSMTWSKSKDSVKLWIQQGNNIFFKIIEDKKKYQKWQSLAYYNSNPNKWDDITIILTRN